MTHAGETTVLREAVQLVLEEGLEGLLHSSELTDDRGAKAEDLLFASQKVEVRVIRVGVEGRKSGLSFVHADFSENQEIHDAAQGAQAENANKSAAEDAERDALKEVGALEILHGEIRLAHDGRKRVSV